MIAIPALDLREGACVQLVGGEYAQERVRLGDPLGVAREWAWHGFRRLHVVDLDAALGRGSNREIVRDLLREQLAEVQVGGGLRTEDAVRDVLDEGARYAIVGTRALEDMDWLAELAHDNPGEIIVAADVRERRITTRGWQQTLPRNIIDVVEELNALPLCVAPGHRRAPRGSAARDRSPVDGGRGRCRGLPGLRCGGRGKRR